MFEMTLTKNELYGLWGVEAWCVRVSLIMGKRLGDPFIYSSFGATAVGSSLYKGLFKFLMTFDRLIKETGNQRKLFQSIRESPLFSVVLQLTVNYYFCAVLFLYGL